MSAPRKLLFLLAITMTAAPVAAAEDADTALKACRAESDDSRRLACYDREMDRLAGPSSTAAAPRPEPPEAPPGAMTAEQLFGREGTMTREDVERKKQESRALDELSATVTEIWTRSDGLMVITLDNGQVWTQNNPDSFFRLKTGDAVRIQPAAMKSFLLSGPSKRSTRVSRLK